jgi:hypothetical protein
MVGVLSLLLGCEPAPQISSSSAPPASSNEVNMSLEEIAESNSARIGELGKSYPIQPKGGFSIDSVTYYPEFNIGSEVLKNTVVLDVIGDYDMLVAFTSDYSYGDLRTVKDESIDELETWVYRDHENDKLYIIYCSPEDVSNYQYFLIGGFETNKNDGKNKLIFEIK